MHNDKSSFAAQQSSWPGEDLVAHPSRPGRETCRLGQDSCRLHQISSPRRWQQGQGASCTGRLRDEEQQQPQQAAGPEQEMEEENLMGRGREAAEEEATEKEGGGEGDFYFCTSPKLRR